MPDPSTGALPLPDFAKLLAPYLGAVAPEALPGFLAQLERGAAQRYRDWADALPGAAELLQACAAGEDEIAERVERILPAPEDGAAAIASALPGARDAYYAVFADLPLREQLRIQADAELQGAAAWRGMAAEHPDANVRAELEACAKLEEESSARLTSLLADPDSEL